LKSIVARHVEETGSRYAARLLHDWERTLRHVWQIVPKEYVKHLPVPLEEATEALVRA